VRALLWVFLPKLVGGLHTFALNLVAVRYLPPEQFGSFNFFTALIALVDGVVGSAVDLGVIRESPTPPARRFTAAESAGLLLKGGMGLAMLAPASFAGPTWLVASLASAVLLLMRSVQVHYQIRERFERFGAGELAHTAIRCVALVALLWWGETRVWVLLLPYLAAPLAVLAMYPARHPQASTGLHQALSTLGRFLRESLLATGTGAALSRADLLMLRATGSAHDLGIYGAAQTIAMVPELVATYLANVFSPRIVPRVRDGTFGAYFAAFHLVAIPVAAVLLGVSLWSLPPLATLVPERYAAAVPTLRVLLPGAFASALLFPLAVSFLLFYSPRTFVRFDLVAAPLLIGAYWYAISIHGAMGAAWVTVVFRCAKAVWILARAYLRSFQGGANT
jgi:O-antigen/teichoic acid export membrane protein